MTTQPAVTGNGFRQQIRRIMARMIPPRWFMVNGPTVRNSVCLTFDDGPHPVHTPRLLDVLAELKVPATFFMIGQQAERYPDLVARIAAQGHAIGHHSYYHTDPHCTSSRQLLAELQHTDQVFLRCLGQAPRLFRPPHGKLTSAKLLRLWWAGWTVVLWNVDPKDFSCHSSDEVRDRLGRQCFQPGDLVLFHDNHPHAAGALPELIKRTQDNGIRFETPLEWLNPKAPRVSLEENC